METIDWSDQHNQTPTISKCYKTKANIVIISEKIDLKVKRNNRDYQSAYIMKNKHGIRKLKY